MKTKLYGKISTPVLTLLALILFGATATFAQTPTLRANGKIAFASRRDGNLEIYSMNNDGTGQTRLTNNTAVDSHPVWSPDERRIAFQSMRDGNNEIYAMNAIQNPQNKV